MDDNIEKAAGGELPKGKPWEKAARSILQAISGAIPLAGGVLSAAAGHWSESEQERINEFLRAWLQMLQDEMREKQETIAEVIVRLDMQDEKIAERVKSDEYQTLLRKAFRNWSGAESRKKREYIRNILLNAAGANLTSDDVVSLFLEWLNDYSEFHFSVIADIYQNPGTTRHEIWQRIGKGRPREDSAEADLFKLLFRDLSTGGVIRQYRETDYEGKFLAKSRSRSSRGSNSNTMKSAFDDIEQYHLTALGQQFVHYAMNELTSKIGFKSKDDVDEHK